MNPNLGGANGVAGTNNQTNNQPSNQSNDELQRLISEAQKAQLEEKSPTSFIGMDDDKGMPVVSEPPSANAQASIPPMPSNFPSADTSAGPAAQPAVSIGEIPVQKSLDETQSTLVGGQPAAVAGAEGNVPSASKQPPAQAPTPPIEELGMGSANQPLQEKQTTTPAKDLSGVEEIINPPMSEQQVDDPMAANYNFAQNNMPQQGTEATSVSSSGQEQSSQSKLTPSQQKIIDDLEALFMEANAKEKVAI